MDYGSKNVKVCWYAKRNCVGGKCLPDTGSDIEVYGCICYTVNLPGITVRYMYYLRIPVFLFGLYRVEAR